MHPQHTYLMSVYLNIHSCTHNNSHRIASSSFPTWPNVCSGVVEGVKNHACTHYELKSFSAVRSDLSHCSTEKRIASAVLFVLFDRPNWICIRKRFCCAWRSLWPRSRLWTLVCVLLALLRWWSPVRMSSYLHIALTLRTESYVSHLYVWAVPSFVFIEFIILTSSHKYASTQHYTSHFLLCKQ